MAITPRSRGLSNIGNIVNRQGMASPTRPMAQPMPRSTVQPVTGGRTTLAQRQAMTPFRNYNTAPVAKIDPLTNNQNLTQQPMFTPAPGGPEVVPNDYMPNFGGSKGGFGLFGSGIGNMAANAVGQGLQGNNGIIGKQLDFFGGQQQMQQAGMTPQQQYQNYSNAVFGGNPNSAYTPNFGQPPQPFNPNPNPVSNMGGGGMPQQQNSNKMFLDANGIPTDDHGGGMMNMNINDFNPSYGGGKSGGY